MMGRAGADSGEYDARVLENFVDSAGRLDGIPAQRKKRMAVLRGWWRTSSPGAATPKGKSTRSSRGGTRTSRHSGATSWTRSSCSGSARSTGGREASQT